MTNIASNVNSTYDRPRIRFFNTFDPVTSIFRDLLPALAEAGLETEAVISRAMYRSERGELQQVVDGKISVRRIPAPVRQMGGRVSRIGIIGSYAIGASGMALLGKTAAANVFLTQPPLFAILGRCLRVLRAQPYVCVIMDLYPDLAIQAGLMKRNSLAGRVLRRSSLALLHNATAVVVIGRCMQRRLVEAGLDSSLIHLIPNWADTGKLKPVPHNENQIRKDLGLQDKFVVMYSGNLGVSHELGSLLQAAINLRDNEEIRFVIVGGGARIGEVEAAQRSHGLNNVIIAPFQPADRLAESLSAGDIHFVSLRPGFEGLVVPSKVYGAMATGRAIVYQGNKTGEIAQMIDEHNCGINIASGDADTLTETLLGMSRDRVRCSAMGALARSLSTGEYAKSQRVSQYLELLQDVSCGKAL